MRRIERVPLAERPYSIYLSILGGLGGCIFPQAEALLCRKDPPMAYEKGGKL